MADPVVLRVAGARKTFGDLQAVDGVSFEVRSGETLGVVGESGSGKSTTARIALRLVDPDEGEVTVVGEDFLALRGKSLRRARRQVQLVPQHPLLSFDPRMSIEDSIALGLLLTGERREARRGAVSERLDQVGLSDRYAGRYPHELSGGQLQRAALARALVTDPKLVVCDEPVSALDKSIQSQILNLLAEVQRELQVSYLFISHDLSVVEHIADRTLVMYRGRVVEEGTAAEIWGEPKHPYTKLLIASMPGTKRDDRPTMEATQPGPSGENGCKFAERCPVVEEECLPVRPELTQITATHRVECVKYTRPPNC